MGKMKNKAKKCNAKKLGRNDKTYGVLNEQKYD